MHRLSVLVDAVAVVRSRRAGRPALSRCAERVAGSGDMMGDGVPRLGGCGCSFFGGCPGWAWQLAGGRSWPQVIGSRARRRVRDGPGSRGGLQRLLPEFTQGVVAAAGE